ncbi:Cof-type HAD-IIB family hydrolase [Acidisoma cellulosilytica]|uniref:Cof-type HAD-IIB family hydrolase n=1 Tax=Acidisoma cellulosilyticum TaxID=2802395 RepID=A0A963Z607_9PROT|nr:Cof-type HAD-IIB family hydrolase [Acidisoma cellulosilyticum]MCB8882507.1 Cof-type HAD-IIB family hydrolase [Acidisoma cellulosilyticum]
MRPRLLVSDVDGTIVRHDRHLAPSTILAAARLRQAGIRLALISSRPPGGLALLRTPLGLDTPCAGFNGALVQDAAGQTVAEHTIPEDACREAVARLERDGLDVWVFAGGEWLLRDAQAAYIAREQLSISMGWRVVPDFTPYLGSAHKVMGSSKDFARCAKAATGLSLALGGQAVVLRSQDYYVDVTHPRANKGEAAKVIAGLLGIDPAEMAAIGDMPNDLPMFAAAGLAVAMGNASDAVKAAAAITVADNDSDGWAEAVDRIIALG